MTAQQAAERQAAHDNLVHELTEALARILGSYQRIKPPHYPKSDAEKQAEASLAKARGEQQ